MHWVLLRTPEAVAFLTVKYAFSHFSWYFFFENLHLHLCRYITQNIKDSDYLDKFVLLVRLQYKRLGCFNFKICIFLLS